MRNLTELDRQIADIQSYISKNKNKLAINILSRMVIADIPEAYRLETAHLAREAGLPLMGLRMLAKVRDNPKAATTDELITYVNCLSDLGSIDEPLKLLETKKEEQSVELLVVRGHVLLKAFEYNESRDCYEKALSLLSPDSELQISIRRQLNHCYRMLGEFEKAVQITDGFAELSKEKQFALELRDFFTTGNVEVKRSIEKRKEQATLETNKEDRRELDFYLAFGTGDQKLKEKLYFGSPFEAFRKRLAQANSGPIELSELYNLGIPSSMEGIRSFDLFKGTELGNPEVKLKVGQVLHRLFVVLTGDFYNTVSVARIHEKVFPGESFHPETSPSRVHQIIKRLKIWLKKGLIPVAIEEQNGSYRMRFQDAYFIKFNREHLALSDEDPLYVRLELTLPGNDFSIKEAAKALGLSRRFARKILERGEHEGWIHMKGRGRTTRYEFHRKGNV